MEKHLKNAKAAKIAAACKATLAGSRVREKLFDARDLTLQSVLNAYVQSATSFSHFYLKEQLYPH